MSWKHFKSLSSPRLLNSEGNTGHFPPAPFSSLNGAWVQKFSGVSSAEIHFRICFLKTQ